MSTVTKDTAPRVADILPKDWAAKNPFSADEMINAYFLGLEDGKKENFDKLKKQFSLNVKLATSISEELLELGLEKDLKFQTIHLKAKNFSSFEALFIIDKDSIESDNFRNAFILGRALREKYKSDKFNLSFLFTPNTEEIDIDCLAADGFFMRYEKRKAN